MTSINTFYAPLQKFFAVIAILAMVFAAIPAPAAFATPSEGGPDETGGRGNQGAIWTTSVSCGPAQNLNQYYVGESLYINGSNFLPGVYTWSVQTANGSFSLGNGSLTVGSDGKVCQFLKVLTQSDIGGPYKVDVGGKNDNFSVKEAVGTLKIEKVIVGNNAATASDFSFSVNGSAAVGFEADGKNEVTITAGDYSVTEPAVANYSSSYSNGCSGTMTNGGTKTCVITNTYTYVPPTYQCSDGLDNDGDGKIDYPADLGCSGPTDDNETDAPVYVCSDGLDNDGDGKTDFPADPGCVDAMDGDETDPVNPPTYQCNDGVDNADPEDQLVDMADPGCSGPTDDDETDPVVPVPVCKIGDNLLANASFETPVVNGSWSIFTGVSDWVISLSDGLEIWRDFMGGASDGRQNIELDGNLSTQITQTVATVPGATYELRFDFSPRPQTAAAENIVDALVDGNVLMSASGDGMSIANNTWTTKSKTFVADASTDIAFKDAGTVNTSYGPLVDNAVLCYVSAPVPGCMDPKATNYDAKATIDDESCDYDNDEPKLCTVTLVSGEDNNDDSRDDNTTVVEKNDALAYIVTPHPLWPTITGAGWLWGDEVVQNTAQGETQTFERKFGFEGVVTSATLTVSSDDSHTTSLNGDPAGSKPSASHVGGQGVYDVTSLVNQGNNDLAIAVTNIGNNNPEWNPAGLAYKLVIEGEVTGDTDCSVPYLDGPLYEIYGYVWHDENENDNWDGSEWDEQNNEDQQIIEEDAEDELAGWIVTITNGLGTTISTETDEYGRYEFNVPAGTWTITETMQTNWSQTFPNSGSHVVVVPQLVTSADAETGVFASLISAFVPTAHAAVLYPTSYGAYNFGNVYKAPTTPSSSSRGGNGRYVSLTNTPRGDVAGDSTDRPEGEVLGDSISVTPVGTPNTGAGGAAPYTATPMTLALLGMIASLVTLRVTRNG